MGPLNGLTVLEFPAIGPVPFCAMLLADLGATVLRLERPEDAGLGIERPRRFQMARVDIRKPGQFRLSAGQALPCQLCPAITRPDDRDAEAVIGPQHAGGHSDASGQPGRDLPDESAA